MDMALIKKKSIGWLKNTDWMEIIFLAIFTWMVIFRYLTTTSFTYDMSAEFFGDVNDNIRYILIGYAVIRTIQQAIIYKKDYILRGIFIILMAVVSYIVSDVTGDIEIYEISLLIIAAQGMDWKTIAKVYVCIAVVIQLIAIYCVYTDVIPDYVYDAGVRGERHSYGIIYPTDLAAHVLFIMIVYTTIRGVKITFSETAVFAVAGYAVYNLTNARNDCICIAILCIGIVVVKVLSMCNIRLSDYKIISITGVIFFVLCVGIIIAVTFYDPANAACVSLDDKLSGRINLSYQALADYGIQTWGSVVSEAGSGAGGTADTYFFIDSSFIRIAVRCGWVFLSIITYIYYLCVTRAREHRQDMIILVFVVMAVFGITEHHILEIAYCPLWLYLYSRDNNKECHNKIISK